MSYLMCDKVLPVRENSEWNVMCAVLFLIAASPPYGRTVT